MKVDFKKYGDGLVPAIVRDYETHKVLMLGFMNEEAFHKTGAARLLFTAVAKKVMDERRGRAVIFLEVKSVAVDCDNDTLLIKANPLGPVCQHRRRHLLERKKPQRRFFVLPRRHY